MRSEVVGVLISKIQSQIYWSGFRKVRGSTAGHAGYAGIRGSRSSLDRKVNSDSKVRSTTSSSVPCRRPPESLASRVSPWDRFYMVNDRWRGQGDTSTREQSSFMGQIIIGQTISLQWCRHPWKRIKRCQGQVAVYHLHLAWRLGWPNSVLWPTWIHDPENSAAGCELSYAGADLGLRMTKRGK